MSTSNSTDGQGEAEQSTAEFYAEHRDEIDALAERDDPVGAVAQAVRAIAEGKEND